VQVLSVSEAVADFACPACRAEVLVAGEDAVSCPACGRGYPVRDGVIDFVITEALSETGRRELAANALDLSSVKAVARATTKGERDWGEAERMRRTAAALDRLLAPDEALELVSLGSGAGFELRHLLARRTFRRVYSSDLAWSRSAVVPQTIAALSGQLVLFASDFEHCPIKRQHGRLGLVFQALHHSDDAHRSLAALLDRNFDDLVLVEPITNWLVELLATLGLAKRTEYSGTKPDWMRIARIRSIARERAYEVRAVTWWDLPVERLPKGWRRRRGVLRLLFAAAAGFSRALSPVGLGSMAAVRLRRRRDP
jgi:uncharacterized protein YbaR (Trm112 family)